MSDPERIKSLLTAMQLASDAPNQTAWRELRLGRYAIEELQRDNNQLRTDYKQALEALKYVQEVFMAERISAPAILFHKVGTILSKPSAIAAMKGLE